jgi:hypothetical protein
VWWIVPLTLLVLGGVIWLLLAGLPFGGEDRPAAPAAVETIGEGTATGDPRTVQTATVVDVPAEDELAPTATMTNEVPPNIRETPPAATATTSPRTLPVPAEPVRTMPVQTATRAPVRTPPRPAPEPVRRGGEISESEAVGTLRSFIERSDPYGIAADCVGVASRGYENVGYTLEVVDTCSGGRMLGRWRVDSKTREVFRQRGDGRYLRP